MTVRPNECVWLTFSQLQKLARRLQILQKNWPFLQADWSSLEITQIDQS